MCRETRNIFAMDEWQMRHFDSLLNKEMNVIIHLAVVGLYQKLTLFHKLFCIRSTDIVEPVVFSLDDQMILRSESYCRGEGLERVRWGMDNRVWRWNWNTDRKFSFLTRLFEFRVSHWHSYRLYTDTGDGSRTRQVRQYKDTSCKWTDWTSFCSGWRDRPRSLRSDGLCCSKQSEPHGQQTSTGSSHLGNSWPFRRELTGFNAHESFFRELPSAEKPQSIVVLRPVSQSTPR